MKPAAFDYAKPADVASALTILADSPRTVKIMAGGQSLGPMLNLRLVRPDLLLDITGIEELRAVEDRGESIRVGACVTHADFEDGRVPDAFNGALLHVARGIAYRAVRNRGTIGGSLTHADPSADWLSTMCALGAKVTLRRGSTSRTILVHDYVLGALEADIAPDEMLVSIDIPKLGPRARWGYYKLCRKTGEFAHAIGAFVFDPDQNVNRVVVGATEMRPLVFNDARALFQSAHQEPLSDALNESAIEAALRRLGVSDALTICTHITALKRAIERRFSA